MNSLKKIVQLLLTPFPSVLKIPVYRLMGAKIGPRTKIGIGTVLLANKIEMGPGSRIKPLTIIAGLRLLSMGAHAHIGNLCIIHGPASLIMKPRGGIGPSCMIDLHADVTIGEYSGPGPRCTLMTHGNSWPAAWGCVVKRAPIVLGDMAWVGFGCKILPGVSICDRTVIMPNSTLGTSVRKPGMIIDNMVKRTAIPFQLAQQAISRSWLRQHLRELVEAYFAEVLEPEGYSLTSHAQSYTVQRKQKTITIHLEHIPTERAGNSEHWLLGFDLPPETLTDNHRCQVVDVFCLLHSPSPSKAMRRALAFFSTNFGIRSSDARDRHHFTIPFPEITDTEAVPSSSAA